MAYTRPPKTLGLIVVAIVLWTVTAVVLISYLAIGDAVKRPCYYTQGDTK